MTDPNIRETHHRDAGPPSFDSPTRPDHAPRPDQVGQYALLELLGEGGMGTVYKARHTLLDRIVALKLLSAGRLADPQSVARFLREIKAVGKLNHPNLVRGADAGQAEGRHFLVMDFLHGLDLARLVQRLGPLPIADACELVRQAALGLQHAHEHGLVHRDIKPSNLMLTPECQLKVLDLGLARLIGDLPHGKEITDTGQYMGTADYMAPEQGLDDHAVDIRADIYSLGCTLYKLLTGRAPFVGPEYDSTFKKIQAHAHVPVPPVRDLRPDVPEALAVILDKMLSKRPAQRHATPAETAAALQQFAGGCDLSSLLARALTGPEISYSTPSPIPSQPFLTPVMNPAALATTHPGPPVVRPSCMPRWAWYGLGAAIVGAAVLLALFLGNRPAPRNGTSSTDHTPPPKRDPLDLEGLAPDEWHDLLARKPTKIAWPENDSLSPLLFDGDGKSLSATCVNGRGLLAFGRSNAEEYEIEMEFLQLPWVGNAGLFFGYRLAPGPKEPVPTYLFLRLQQANPLKPDKGFRIGWEEVVVRSTAKGPVHLPAKGLSSSQVIYPLDCKPHRLRASFTGRGLDKVSWDGVELDMNTELPAPVRANIQCQGVFGVCLYNNTTVVLQFRYRYKVR
jgi:eukaryotic-like serine/threonine-protein kinase